MSCKDAQAYYSLRILMCRKLPFLMTRLICKENLASVAYDYSKRMQRVLGALDPERLIPH